MTHGKGKDQDKVISLRRAGAFEVGWKMHKEQCGYYGERQMTYDVCIKGRETDCPAGWLLDNNDVPQYFKVTYRRINKFQSCETIASRAVDDFRRICRKYRAEPFYIRVGISGIAQSEIACEWTSRKHTLSH
jgi:hypothetical protein